MSLNIDSDSVFNNKQNINKIPQNRNKILLQAFIVLSATFSNLSDGLSTGWTSTAIAQMMTNASNSSTLKIDSNQAALIGTLPMYAIFCSAPISIYSANKIGRKWSILWGSTLTFASWLFLIFGRTIATIYTGCFLRGLGGNVIFTVIPMYSAEIANAKIRGVLGSFVAAMMNIGVLLSYILTLVSPLWVTAVVGAATALIVWPLFVWAPRSPYHMLVKGEREKAKQILVQLHGAGLHIEAELLKMEESAAEEAASREKSVPILELVTVRNNRHVTIIVVVLQFIQQLTGVDAILIFLEFILEDKDSSIIFGVSKLVSCLVSLVLVDRIGRKPLLIFSCLMSCLMLLVLGTYFYARDNLGSDVSTLKSWLPLTVLVVFISSYNIGLGIVPFILGGEMYPTRIKALGVTFGEAMYALPMIISTNIFSLTREAYGVHVPFWIYAFCSLLGAVFCWKIVVETKAKTLEEIQQELKER